MKFTGNLLEILPLSTEKQLLQFNTENGLLKVLVSDTQYVKYFVNEQGARRGSQWELTLIQLLDEYERELSFKLTDAKEIVPTEEPPAPTGTTTDYQDDNREVAYGETTPIEEQSTSQGSTTPSTSEASTNSDSTSESKQAEPTTSTAAQQQDTAFQAASRANEDPNSAQQFDESYHPKDDFGQDITNGGYDAMLAKKLPDIDPEETDVEIDPVLAGLGLLNTKPSFNTGKKVEEEDNQTSTFGSRQDISDATDQAEAAETDDDEDDENNGYVGDDEQLPTDNEDDAELDM